MTHLTDHSLMYHSLIEHMWSLNTLHTIDKIEDAELSCLVANNVLNDFSSIL